MLRWARWFCLMCLVLEKSPKEIGKEIWFSGADEGGGQPRRGQCPARVWPASCRGLGRGWRVLSCHGGRSHEKTWPSPPAQC